MTGPPAYPRIPYLWSTASATTGDRVVPAAEREPWLQRPVVVEEKLDGANVSLWWEDRRLRVASRGGADAMDRAGQLGPLRAWADAGYETLRPLLEDGLVLFGEWLWLTHTVSYDRLPDFLVVFDVWSAGSGFADPSTRDRLLVGAGLVGPPRLFEGTLGAEETLDALIGTSRFGAGPMEGVVLRDADGLRCKVVRRGFRRVGDEDIGRGRNRVGR